MKLDDLQVLSGLDFHENIMWHHLAKFDETPVYFLNEPDCWLTICQHDDEDDNLWRGECDFFGYDFYDYDGRETPEEVLTMLMLDIQIWVAEGILEEMEVCDE